MKNLSIDELNHLRIKVFENAESLHKEAKLLLDNKMFSRSYLLAHFCFEELGKLPIIVGVIAKKLKGEEPNWRNVNKRFYSHVQKIASQNGHLYAFGSDPDLIRNSDLEWLLTANNAVEKSFQKKNLATYVDTQAGKILIPAKEITEDDATEIVKLTFECLKAHWRSENLTNPQIYEAENPIDEQHAG